MKHLLSFLLIMSIGAIAAANSVTESATESKETSDESAVREERRETVVPRHRFGPPPGDQRRFTEEEWEQVAEFMAEHSPERWKVFEQLNPRNAHRRPLMNHLYWRYKRLEQIREEDPDYYDLRLQQVQLEDKAFGLVMRHNLAEDARAESQIEADLRKVVGELFDIGVQERKRRIERLEQALAAEKQRLEKDQAEREVLIYDRSEEILEEGGLVRGIRPRSPQRER